MVKRDGQGLCGGWTCGASPVEAVLREALGGPVYVDGVCLYGRCDGGGCEGVEVYCLRRGHYDLLVLRKAPEGVVSREELDSMRDLICRAASSVPHNAAVVTTNANLPDFALYDLMTAADVVDYGADEFGALILGLFLPRDIVEMEAPTVARWEAKPLTFCQRGR